MAGRQGIDSEQAEGGLAVNQDHVVGGQCRLKHPRKRLLATDLVMQQSAAALGMPGTAKGLAVHGAAWAPWRSYAGLHLWRARPVTSIKG